MPVNDASTVLPPPAGSGAPPMSGSTWGWLIALLGWTVLLNFYRLDADVGLEPVDAWVAQTSREMSENIARMVERAPTDGWHWEPFIIPQFSGEVRMQKSPGAYWVAMLVAHLRGTPVDEACVRIPNAAAGVIIVLTCFWLTRRIAGDRAGIFAGFAASASVFVLHFSRGGSADLPITALMTLALACLWVGAEQTPPGARRGLWWCCGYFVAGLAMLYKMPMPLVCVGIPAALYVLLRRRWRLLASGWHLAGFALFALPWLPWGIATVQLEPTALDKWRVEFLDRATGDLPNVREQTTWEHYFLYLGVAFVLAAPFSLSIPGALAQPLKRRNRPDGGNQDGIAFLWLWFVGLLVAFTLFVGKETRYLLPAMPPLLMLLGCELADFFAPPIHPRSRLRRVGSILACLVTAAGLAAAGYALYTFAQKHPDRFYFWDEAWLPLLVAGLILLVGLTAAAFLYPRRPNASFAAMVATMWAMWLWTWPAAMPILGSQGPSRDFAAQLRTLDAAQRAALRQVAHQDPRIIWYSDVRFPRVIDQLEMLRVQGGRRSLEAEIEMVGRRMIELLRGPELALFVTAPGDYILFHADAEFELRRRGEEAPKTYLWLVARVGHDLRRYLLFGNQPPPWPSPEVPPETARRIQKRLDSLSRGADGVPQPASVPASSRSSEPQ